MSEPTIADLLPFLTERGKIELDFAFASWRASKAEARVAELEALTEE